MEHYTTVYSYPKAWSIENKIYSIMNMKLIVPLYPRQILYFGAVLLCMVLLSKLPVFAKIPLVIRYFIVPFALGNFLLKKKLDGKNPVRFFMDWLRWVSQRSLYLERFCWKNRKMQTCRLQWYAAKGVYRG